MSHKIVVMYLGKIIETATTESLMHSPKHPYTEALFAAALPSRPDEQHEEIPLAGEIPSPLRPPPGCHFHPRCIHAMERCSAQEPSFAVREGRLVACHLYEEDVAATPALAHAR
jgi:oligopeptide/dipeptide ABC transporter ATP-binding protein